jgi:hypothetical protein
MQSTSSWRIWALQSGAAFQGAYKVPGALTAADFRKAAEAGGFTGNIIVGTDLASLRIPGKWAGRVTGPCRLLQGPSRPSGFGAGR